MKVLHIIDKLDFGGAQMLVKSILESAGDKKVEHSLLALRQTNSEFKIKSKKVRILSNDSKYNPMTFLRFLKFISKIDHDFFHIHLDKSLFLAAIASLLWKNKQFFVHEHGKIFEKKNYSPYSLLLKFWGRKAKKIIAVSQATKTRLIKTSCIDPRVIVVLNNPIYKERLKLTKKQANLNKIITIGYLGRLSKEKGVIYLLKGIKLLKKNYPKIKLIIIGDGNERSALERYVRRSKLQSSVDFVGFQKSVTPYINKFDIAVIPSLFESQGIVPLELMFSGIPIVASKVGGLAEILEDRKTALLFKAKDHEKLALKIEELVRNQGLRKKLINNGRREVKKYFIDKYIDRLNKLYSSL